MRHSSCGAIEMTEKDIIAKEQIVTRIFRFNSDVDSEPRFDEFILPYSRGVTILGILRYIYENLDPTLAFRNYHCGASVCGCCQVRVNGKQTKSCSATILPGETVIIEPYDRNKVVRDLVVTFDE